MDIQLRLDIRLLGPLEVTVGGRPTCVAGSKRGLLLALLALRNGRSVAVHTLMEELWGADVPVTERNAVQHHIARLRTTLGREAIVGSGDGYAVPHATTDAAVFEQLLCAARAALRTGDASGAAELAARALGLWRGAALDGLANTPWLRAEADRLEELRIDALEERFEAALALGEHRESISELQVTIAESPFRERLWRQLMLALYRSGRQADALETYQTARRVHVERLGLEPSPELRRVQEAILSHDPAVAGAPTAWFDTRRDDLASVLAQLRDSLRHAEELYASVQVDGIAGMAA